MHIVHTTQLLRVCVLFTLTLGYLTKQLDYIVGRKPSHAFGCCQCIDCNLCTTTNVYILDRGGLYLDGQAASLFQLLWQLSSCSLYPVEPYQLSLLRPVFKVGNTHLYTVIRPLFVEYQLLIPDMLSIAHKWRTLPLLQHTHIHKQPTYLFYAICQSW